MISVFVIIGWLNNDGNMHRKFLITPLLVLSLSLGLSACGVGDPASSAANSNPLSVAPINSQLEYQLLSLEKKYDADISVSAVDVATGKSINYRSTDRYLYASTAKVFAVAAFLEQSTDSEKQQRLSWTKDDVDQAGYAPVTGQHLEHGLTAMEVAEAAIRDSDNAAMNLILEKIGGPSGFDDWLRSLGDETSEVVNQEPKLNIATPGSDADTTTTAAFSSNLAELFQDDHLSPHHRETLLEWMTGNEITRTLSPAGAPDGWNIADKSGGSGALRNDIAIATAPTGGNVALSVFTRKVDQNADYEDELVADATRVVLHEAEKLGFGS
ncbi:class A beta-lactamase [Glutamicibacter protophormiae]|uniref:class A beta-lactamase n=1 Tax=Glutamicibacter protophormiae TaxID=37930 RepID=UPI00331764A6